MSTTELREIVARAISAPDRYAALELDYLRGHELSGTVRFKVTGAGDYELDSDATRDERPRSWSGKLDPADREALLSAIGSTGMLDAMSSTRNIKDDEEPILVSLEHEALRHELRVWHDDVGAAGLAAFEAHVNALVRKLSGGEIITIAAG